MGSKKRNSIIQFIKFNIIGIINTGVTYLIYAFLVYIGFHYRLALGLEYCCGVVISFVLNKKFTFKNSEKSNLKMFLRMVITYVGVFIVNWGMLELNLKVLKMDEYIGQIVAQSIIAISSFFAQKIFVFKDKFQK